MADSKRSTDPIKSNSDGNLGGYDTAPGARPVAPGAASSARGRTSADLATDQPAGHASPDVYGGAGALPGAHDVTGDWGPTDVDPNTGGDIRRGRQRDLQPQVDPDTRLGLNPVASSDAFPDPPPDVRTDTRTRVATGAVAGTIAAAFLAGLFYLLFWTGVAGAPGFVAVERAIFGVQGVIDHLVGLAGFLIVFALWGALFGLMVAWPTTLKGMAFGLLPTFVHWLVAAPMMGYGVFNDYTPVGLGLPLLYYALIWGGITGNLAGRWLRPPYTADVPPTTTAADLEP